MANGPAQPPRRRTLRQRLASALDPALRHKPGLSLLNIVLVVLVLVSTAVVVIETDDTIYTRYAREFLVFERAIGAIFIVEYLARLWCSAENPRFGRGWRGKLRYMVSFGSIIDLLAILPSLLLFNGQTTLSLRMFRVLRMLRIARLGRMSTAWSHMVHALASRRDELFLAFCAGLILMLISSTLLWMVEGEVQPRVFGSIPKAMWWSVITLTTIGYGDAIPITPVGKILAGITAFGGIGLIAMPTGIIASALSDGVARRRAMEDEIRKQIEAEELAEKQRLEAEQGDPFP